MMGWSSGLVFETTGGSMPRGRRAPAWAILVCTSCRAASMSRLRSNSMLMLAEPWREVDEICLTPSTEVTTSSMVSTTSVSMTSGDAPS